MVNKAAEQDLAKIKRLIASALSPREKAMYESLLHKAEQQIAKVRDSETVTKVEVGYWQYVGFSSCPGITVMRNYSESLAKKVNKAENKKAKLWLKPHHIPFMSLSEIKE
jgi:hypothetical protein